MYRHVISTYRQLRQRITKFIERRRRLAECEKMFDEFISASSALAKKSSRSAAQNYLLVFKLMNDAMIEAGKRVLFVITPVSFNFQTILDEMLENSEHFKITDNGVEVSDLGELAVDVDALGRRNVMSKEEYSKMDTMVMIYETVKIVSDRYELAWEKDRLIHKHSDNHRFKFLLEHALDLIEKKAKVNDTNTSF